jgi:hypothetical protein
MPFPRSRALLLALSGFLVFVTAVAGSAALRSAPGGEMFDGRLYGTGRQAGPLLSADLDADGDTDLIATGPAGPIAVALANGDGTFEAPRLHETGAVTAAVGNFNRDAVPDLVVTRERDGVAVVPGVGGGAFGAALPAVFLGARPGSLAACDVDGDGLDDLALTTHNDDEGESALWFLRNDGETFRTPVRLAQWDDGAVDDHDYAPPVVTGDLNADGRPDLVATRFGGGGVSLFLASADGGFAAGPTYEIDDPVTAMAMSDFDDDGVTDLAVTTVPALAESDPGTVLVMAGRGDGTLRSQRVHPLPAAPYSLTVADLDGNGSSDLAVANPYADTVSVLLGTGEGTFGAPHSHPAQTWPLSLTAGDLSSDGIPDLAVATDDGMWVLRNLLHS